MATLDDNLKKCHSDERLDTTDHRMKCFACNHLAIELDCKLAATWSRFTGISRLVCDSLASCGPHKLGGFFKHNHHHHFKRIARVVVVLVVS